MWYIHRVECYSTVKRNEVFRHVTIVMNLENITPSERNQSQKDTYYMNVNNTQIHRDTSKLVVARKWGQE